MNVLTMAVRCHFPFSFFLLPSSILFTFLHLFLLPFIIFLLLFPSFLLSFTIFLFPFRLFFYYPLLSFLLPFSIFFPFPHHFLYFSSAFPPLLCFYSPSVILNYPFEICLKETLKFCA